MFVVFNIPGVLQGLVLKLLSSLGIVLSQIYILKTQGGAKLTDDTVCTYLVTEVLRIELLSILHIRLCV